MSGFFIGPQPASETQAGIARFATQAEVIEGTAGDVTVTPATLYGYTRRFFVGAVKADGTILHAPPGWTCQKLGIGRYLIVHNAGTMSYGVLLTLYQTARGYITVESQTANDFTVQAADKNDAMVDTTFTFGVAV